MLSYKNIKISGKIRLQTPRHMGHGLRHVLGRRRRFWQMPNLHSHMHHLIDFMKHIRKIAFSLDHQTHRLSFIQLCCWCWRKKHLTSFHIATKHKQNELQALWKKSALSYKRIILRLPGRFVALCRILYWVEAYLAGCSICDIRWDDRNISHIEVEGWRKQNCMASSQVTAQVAQHLWKDPQ